jgi:hypothetical protein
MRLRCLCLCGSNHGSWVGISSCSRCERSVVGHGDDVPYGITFIKLDQDYNVICEFCDEME